jgi:hypothetical protein
MGSREYRASFSACAMLRRHGRRKYVTDRTALVHPLLYDTEGVLDGLTVPGEDALSRDGPSEALAQNRLKNEGRGTG